MTAPRTSPATTRRRLFQLHQATGVALSAVLAVTAATGAVLVFRGCVKDPPPTAPEVAEPLAVAAMLARAQALAGDEAITDIGLPQETGDPWVFWVDDDAETVLYLAGDGALLERRATAGGVMRLLFQLHTGELGGVPGQALALLGGVGLAALLASGLGMLASRRRSRKP